MTEQKRARKKKRPTSAKKPESLAAKIAASEEGDVVEVEKSAVPATGIGLKVGPLGNHDFVEHGSPAHAQIVLGLDPETHEPMFDLSNVTKEQAKRFVEERVRQLNGDDFNIRNAPPMWNPDDYPDVEEVRPRNV